MKREELLKELTHIFKTIDDINIVVIHEDKAAEEVLNMLEKKGIIIEGETDSKDIYFKE
jgi:hypothetical protein